MPSRPRVRTRRWQATLIVTLVFTAAVGAAAVGWWYARESPPHQGPIVAARGGRPVERGAHVVRRAHQRRAGHRRARRRERRLRARLHPLAADAAGVHVAAHRTAAVRSRRPRRGRLRAEDRHAHPAPSCCAAAASRPAPRCRRSCCARPRGCRAASRSTAASSASTREDRPVVERPGRRHVRDRGAVAADAERPALHVVRGSAGRRRRCRGPRPARRPEGAAALRQGHDHRRRRPRRRCRDADGSTTPRCASRCS